VGIEAQAENGKTHFFVGGDWVAPAGSDQFDVINPATEEVYLRMPTAVEADMDRAVAAARAAFDEGPWPHLSVKERVDIITAATDRLAGCGDEIARTITAEMGGPLRWTSLQPPNSIDAARQFSDVALAAELEVLREAATDALVVREPAGVVAAICPWNGPYQLSFHKIVPAILAGCTTVFKAAPETPYDAFYFAAALEAAGLPPGVVNMVPGGREVGRHLVEHPDVDLVTFTGSTLAGRTIAEHCGRALKRAHLELGGKSAAIVLDDADLEQVVPCLVQGAFFNSGQTCSLCTRVVVHRSLYDRVVAELSERASALVVGDPLDPETFIGPLVAKRQQDRVLNYIELGKQEGARLVVGGGVPQHLPTGWYVEPTVFADVDNSMRIAQEEIFGPVVVVIPFDDDEQAVRIANDSDYGLAGAVHSADPDRALAIARRIVTGMVTVNGFLTSNRAAPFGGRKASGVGREYGPEGFAEFLEYKTINLPRRRTG
jgi:betaine-aldehyde dehydrogenase